MNFSESFYACIAVGLISFGLGLGIGELVTSKVRVDEINRINGKLYKLVEVEPVYVEVER